MAKLYYPANMVIGSKVEDIEPDTKTGKVSWDKIKEIINGHVNAVRLTNGRMMFCDEDGEARNLAANIPATLVANWQYELRGKIIIGDRKEFKL